MTGAPDLPADSHVHSEWSWDADFGAMDATCARAVEIGLPAVAFTEHLDFTPFRAGQLVENFADLVEDGILVAPTFDVTGYLECVDRCRVAYPGLRILTGVEVGQPHLHREQVAEVLAQGRFERVLGSLHCLLDGDAYAEPWELVTHRSAREVLREYLLEVPRLVGAADLFDAVAHIDYPLRFWPDDEHYDAKDFEDEWRHALRAVAATGQALEVNTRVPMDPVLVGWWREEGGTSVTFGSDAHEPDLVGDGLREAAAMVTAHGFRESSSPADFWTMRR